MKLNCNKNELYKLVALADRNTGKNQTLVALSSILLRASKNRLFVISTNLEVGFEGNIAASIEEEGEILSPSKTLLSILYSISDEEINAQSAGGNLKIISKTSSTNLKCLPADEFPVIPKIKKENPNDPHLININTENIKEEDREIQKRYEQLLNKGLTLTEEEYNEFFNEFVIYRNKVFKEIEEKKTHSSRLDFVGYLGK